MTEAEKVLEAVINKWEIILLKDLSISGKNVSYSNAVLNEMISDFKAAVLKNNHHETQLKKEGDGEIKFPTKEEAKKTAELNARERWGKYYDDVTDYGTDKTNGDISEEDFVDGYILAIEKIKELNPRI